MKNSSNRLKRGLKWEESQLDDISPGRSDLNCQESERENNSNRKSELNSQESQLGNILPQKSELNCQESQRENNSSRTSESECTEYHRETTSCTEIQEKPDSAQSILRKPNPNKNPPGKQKTNDRNMPKLNESAKQKKYTGFYAKPKKYTEFYADYCSSTGSRNCFCHKPKTCTDLDLVTSYLKQKTCISKIAPLVPVTRPRKLTYVPLPAKKEPKKPRACCQPCTSYPMPTKLCFRSDEKSLRSDRTSSSDSSETTASSDTTVKSISSSSSKTEATEYDEDEQDFDKLGVQTKTDLKNCCPPKCPVKFTSSLLLLLHGVFVTYAIGVNLAEYISYKGGLHGRTFFLVPYLLRFLTIGCTLMSDFFSFLLCSCDMPCFVDLLFRIFVYSFLTAYAWNIIEFFMETHHVHPLIYFGGSGGLFLVAVNSVFNRCR